MFDEKEEDDNDNIRWFGSFYSMRPYSNEILAQTTDRLMGYFHAYNVNINEYLLTTAQIMMASRSLLIDNIMVEDRSVSPLELEYRTDAFEDMLELTPDEIKPVGIYSTIDVTEAGSIYGTITCEDRDWKKRAKEKKKEEGDGLTPTSDQF